MLVRVGSGCDRGSPGQCRVHCRGEREWHWYAGYADGYSGYVSAEFLTEAPPLPEISLADWDTSIWQGAALGETNVRAEPTTESEIIARTRVRRRDRVGLGQGRGGLRRAPTCGRRSDRRIHLRPQHRSKRAGGGDRRVPADARAFGRWIDVNLTQQLMHAYEAAI